MIEILAKAMVAIILQVIGMKNQDLHTLTLIMLYVKYISTRSGKKYK